MRAAVSIVVVVLTLIAACVPSQSRGRAADFTVVEATIPDIQRAMAEGRLTSRDLVLQYLTRIALYEESLNAAMAVNARALEEAEERDRERAAGIVRGSLHGVPVALKDNIQTMDLPTTGGASAFAGFFPPYDATVTKNLRDAGAIILAKTVMGELAGVVVDVPIPYSTLGGFGVNPYDPRRDPRPGPFAGQPLMPTGGSSNGTGTAANLWAASVGTETRGSLLSPSSQSMLVGIKPTVGRISRYGVIPIALDQDTPGPMARSVTDAAILLGVLEGMEPDPMDTATLRCERLPGADYTAHLKTNGLMGARIGVPRAYFQDPVIPPLGTAPVGGLTPPQKAAMTEAIEVLKRVGALVIEPADVPSVTDDSPDNNLLLWSPCRANPHWRESNCSSVLDFGIKRDFNAWLASLGPAVPVRTTTELVEWNQARPEAIRYGQSRLVVADGVDTVADRRRYEADRAKDIHLASTHGLDEVMELYRLDALLFPGSAAPPGADIAARAGYPTVIVPFALVFNPIDPPLPNDFQPLPEPFGIAFTGRACSEPRLIELAYAFEQATKRRIPPESAP